MIIPTKPVLSNPKDTEEVRKALENMAQQLNTELAKINERLTALETP